MAREYSITCQQCGNTFVTENPDRVVCGEDCNRLKLGVTASERTGEKSNLFKDGRTDTPEYVAYLAMNQRCYYTKHRSYEDYGGRGIKVADEWRGEGGYERFLAHVGERPSPQHTLDRFPDNNGNYAPGNVRWATRTEQAANRRPRTLGTHCREGHEFTPENTIVEGKYRRCRTCCIAKGRVRADAI